MGDVRLTGNFLATARCLIFADSASGVWSFNTNTNTLTITAAGGGTAFANPTAKVGLTAVNGSATTMMRSDGAPPIDQAIVPTWTGLHTFGGGLTVSGGSFTLSGHTLTLSATASVGGTNTGDQVIPGGANPSASVGLSAVNGSAATFMRSDGAPALSVAITPTWTGEHIWSTGNGGNTSIRTTGDIDIGVAGTSVLSSSARALLYLNNTDAAVEWASEGTTQAYIYASTTEFRIAAYQNIPINFYQNGAAAVSITGPTTTGSATATFAAVNMPGSNASVISWLPVKTAAGVQGYIPIFG